MPPVKPETQEQLPLDGDPTQNMEDPGAVAEMFQKNAEQLKQEAAATLVYEGDTPPAVEQAAEAELAAEPEVKPAKKAKKAKEKVEVAPIVEPEIPAEPKISRREAFKVKADEEITRRTKEDRLKEREAAVQASEDRHKAFEADPVKFLEDKDPRFYEKLTERYLSEGKTPEKAEVATLRAEINALREQITGTQENTSKEIQLAKYERDLNEGERILSGAEFDAVRESADLHERFNGHPSDLRRALAETWIDFRNSYGKELTAAECCEILLEDAQAHIERVGKEFGQKETPAEPPKKKKTPPTGKTLTNAQETASAPAQEFDPSQYKSKAELLKAVSENTLEYEEEPVV